MKNTGSGSNLIGLIWTIFEPLCHWTFYRLVHRYILIVVKYCSQGWQEFQVTSVLLYRSTMAEKFSWNPHLLWLKLTNRHTLLSLYLCQNPNNNDACLIKATTVWSCYRCKSQEPTECGVVTIETHHTTATTTLRVNNIFASQH